MGWLGEEHGGAVGDGEFDAVAGAVGDIEPLAGPDESVVVGRIIDDIGVVIEADLLGGGFVERGAMAGYLAGARGRGAPPGGDKVVDG